MKTQRVMFLRLHRHGDAGGGFKAGDNCGKKLEKTCRSCSAANRPNARFCANCGAPFETLEQGLSPAGPDTSGAQQKQGTILFADISGFSRRTADFNPIENMWSKVKQTLRSLAPRTGAELLEAAKAALAGITCADCHGFFLNARYAT